MSQPPTPPRTDTGKHAPGISETLEAYAARTREHRKRIQDEQASEDRTEDDGEETEGGRPTT